MINRELNEYINEIKNNIIKDFEELHTIELRRYENEIIRYLRNIAEKSYHYGFLEPHADDEISVKNS